MIYKEQRNQGWPGLAREVTEICEQLDIPDVNIAGVSKGDMARAVHEMSRKDWMKKMEKSDKLNDLVEQEDGRMKEYMKIKNISDSRIMFRARTKMIPFKNNMKNMYGREHLQCDQCTLDVTESQSHVLVCSGYEDIRRDLDVNTMDGLIEYYKEVMNIRFSK